ncbi:5266_t:CDS:2 [Funneliformis geosporum]|nr:5266_t:CDS:2 [Funneliformis geosporum]
MEIIDEKQGPATAVNPVDTHVYGNDYPKTDFSGKGNYRGFYPIVVNTYDTTGGTAATDTADATVANYDPGNGAFNIFNTTEVNLQELNDDGTNGTLKKKKKLNELTKICFDILDDATLNEVVRKAFLENTFDELTGKSHNEMLELYDYVAKSDQMRNGTIYTGKSDENPRKRLKAGYDMAKGLADLLDKKPTTIEEWGT